MVAVYRGGRKSLEGRVVFVNIDEASPAAGYITLNEPIKEQARIQAAVKAGPHRAHPRRRRHLGGPRATTPRRQVAAFASGAQYVSTDYMRPDERFGPYQARLPGGGVARISPARP